MFLWYAARRYGISDVTDDYLVLLSHGIQVCGYWLQQEVTLAKHTGTKDSITEVPLS